jgi:intracellular sulfur oxidation DsrE/DsrF family protein
MVQASGKSNTVILMTANGMGQADPELQHTLNTKYFQILLDDSRLPAAICFYTEGVRLTCTGSPVLEQLRALQDRGVTLIVCSTCLHYFQLADQHRVGIVGSMADIIEAQWQADKVITL